MAYDCGAIESFIRIRGCIQIIDSNNCGNGSRPRLDPAKKERFKMRIEVERRKRRDTQRTVLSEL
jgi:hypothetical protein